MMFSSPVYSYGRLFYTVFFSFGIWIGILADEFYMLNNKFYAKYMYLVGNRFIPDLLNPLSRKLERILNSHDIGDDDD